MLPLFGSGLYLKKMEPLKEIRRNREFDRLCYERLRNYMPKTFQYLINALFKEPDCDELIKELQKRGTPGDTLVIFIGVLNYLTTQN